MNTFVFIAHTKTHQLAILVISKLFKLNKSQRYMPLRNPYNNQGFNCQTVDSSQLEPFMSSWNATFRVHTGQLFMENNLYCAPFRASNSLHSPLIYSKGVC